MSVNESHRSTSQQNAEFPTWLTKAGPTESFRRTAPHHLLQDNRETAPAIDIDPGYFTTVGPTPSFAKVR